MNLRRSTTNHHNVSLLTGWHPTRRDLLKAGAAAGLAAVEDRMDAEAYEEWGRHWETGARLLEGLTDAMARYQPANRRQLPVRKGPTDVSRVEPAFSHVAEAFAGVYSSLGPAKVRCWSERDWVALLREMNAVSPERYPIDGMLGFTDLGGNKINLAPEVCDGLVALHYEGARPSGDMTQIHIALAVGTLAHELEHTRRVANEAAAECYGMQALKQVARRLGADVQYASELATVYWEEVYPLNPPRYRSPACRPGGPLDLTPATPAWP